MNETTSLILFCIFMAVFLGMILSNIVLVKQKRRRIAFFLVTVVLPFIPFMLYYFYEAPRIKGTREMPKDIGQTLLRMDMLTFYLVFVFIIQAVCLLYFMFNKWKKA